MGICMAMRPESGDIEHLRPALMRGEAESYRLLVRGLTGPLYRYVHGVLGEADSAQDVVQQTFIRLYQSRKKLTGQGNLRTLCFTIATNLARNALRDRALREQRTLEAVMQQQRHNGISETAAQSDIAQAAWDMLPTLEPEVREVLLLHFAQGFSLSETADMLAIPAGTAKTRCRRGLEQLREKLSGHAAFTASPAIGIESLGAHLSSSPVVVPSNLINAVEAGVMATISVKTGFSLIAACILLLLALGGGAAYVLFETSGESPPEDTDEIIAGIGDSDPSQQRKVSGNRNSAAAQTESYQQEQDSHVSNTQPAIPQVQEMPSDNSSEASQSASEGVLVLREEARTYIGEKIASILLAEEAAPSDMIARFGSKRPFDCGSQLHAVAISPGEEKQIAVCGEDFTVMIWDQNGREIWGKDVAGLDCIEPVPLYVRVVFSPDGKYMAAAGLGSGSIIILDREANIQNGSKSISTIIRAHTNGVQALAFSANGKHLYSGGEDGFIRVWSITDWNFLTEIKAHEQGIDAIALSHDGAALYSIGHDLKLKAWNIVTQTAIFSSDIAALSRNITISQDQTSLYISSLLVPVVMFDAASGEPRDKPFGEMPAWDVEPIPGSSRVITIHTCGVINIWEPFSPEPVTSAQADTTSFNNISDVEMSDDGSLIAISHWSGQVSLWRYDGLKFEKIPPEQILVNGTMETSDGVTYSIMATTLAERIQPFDGKITTLEVTPDGTHFIAGTESGTLDIRTIEDAGVTTHLHDANAKFPMDMVFGPGNRLASAHTFGMVNIWDWSAGKLLLTLKEPLEGHVGAIAWSGDGNYVATADWSGKVMLWDVVNGLFVRTFESAHPIRTNAITILGDRVVTGDDNGMLHIWDLPSGALLFAFNTGHSGVTDVLIMPARDDYDIISTGGDGALRTWRLDSAEATLVRETEGSFKCNKMCISPDGKFLVSAHDDVARVWDIPTWTCLKKLKGHDGAVTAVAITPDSTRVLTGGKDKTVIVWKLKE